MTLQEFVLGIIGSGAAGGGLSYLVARYLLFKFVPVEWTPQMKRLAAYIISAALGVVALAVGSYLGYVQMTWEMAFTAATTAFYTSQALHGLLDLGSKSGT